MFSLIILHLLLALAAAGSARAFRNSSDNITWKTTAPPRQVALLYPNGTASLGPAFIGLEMDPDQAGAFKVPVKITVISPSGASQSFDASNKDPYECVWPTVDGDSQLLIPYESAHWEAGVTLNETGTYTLIYNVTFGTPSGPPTGHGSNDTYPCGTGAYTFQSFFFNATFPVANTTTKNAVPTQLNVQLSAIPTGSGYHGRSENGARGAAQGFVGVSSVLALALATAIMVV